MVIGLSLKITFTILQMLFNQPRKAPALAASSLEGSLLELNLVRAWWILVVSTTFTVLFTISGYLTGTSSAFSLVQQVDYTLSSLSFLLFWLARWGRCPGWLRCRLPLYYAYFFVLINDGYYFSAWPVSGDNVGYAFGVLTPAALLYLRPRFFIPFLIVNHLVVCGLILQQHDKFEGLVSAIYGTSITMLIAVISSIIHYRSKVTELEKTAIVARRNRELAASNASMLAMSQRMDEMMALAAHDLRSPLQGVVSLCDMELDKPGGRETGQDHIFEAIREGSNRMSSLVNNMLSEYSARHSSLSGLSVVACDLVPVLQAATNQAQPLAVRKHIDLDVLGLPPSALAEGNPEALGRVFGNLLSNAIKYSPEGSLIQLRIEPGEDVWLCEVRDEGPGIAEGDRKALFDKFERGTNRPTSGEESSGLGLYSARKLAEAMGGKLSFEPRPGGGSIFRIALVAA